MKSLNHKISSLGISKATICGFLLCICLIMGLSILKTPLQRDGGTISFDMSSDKAGIVNIWINNQTIQPFTVKLESNTRIKYEVKGLDDDISYIRIDPFPEVGNRTFYLHEVEIKGPDGQKQIINTNEIAKWKVYGSEHAVITSGGVEYLTGGNTIIVSDDTYSIELFYPKLLHKIYRLLTNLNNINNIISFYLFILVLVSTIYISRLYLLLYFTIICSLIVLAKLFLKNEYGPISVSQSIGLAAFTGRSTFPNTLYLLATFLAVAIIVNIIYIYLVKKYNN